MAATGTIPEAFYAQLDAGLAVPVSSEIRRHGDPTPAVVYEVTRFSPFLDHSGGYVMSGTLTVRLDCVADAANVAWTTGLDAVAAIDGLWSRNGWQFQMTSVEMAQTRAAPDDGQADAERICVVTAEFQVREI